MKANIPRSLLTLSILCMIIGCVAFTRAASLVDFGHRHIADNGLGTLGHRPLLVILVEFNTNPRLALGHPVNFYDSLIFDRFATNGTPTVNGYFLENSNDRFFWSRAGVIRLSLSPNETMAAFGDASVFYSNVVAQAMITNVFNFSAYTNSDSLVTQDELQIMIVRADAPRDGNNRSFGTVQPPGFNYAVQGSAVQVGHLTEFSTILHELGHALQPPFALELYGVWAQECMSHRLTIMSCTPEDAAWHFDPWHKLEFGWCEPRIRSLRAGGVETLPAPQLKNPQAPILLYDPEVGANEFFMIEYRSPTVSNGSLYDARVAGNGLVVWHVKQNNYRPLHVPRLDAGPFPAQSGWRFCEKCKGLHFTGNSALGVCPAGDRHSVNNSTAYLVVNNVPAAPGQHGWRWCRKCEGLFFGNGEGDSRCPASGTHDGSQSGDYSIVQNVPNSPGQAGWRWCLKCQGIFFGPNQAASRCPAEGTHDGSGSGDYAMLLEGSNEAVWAEGSPGFQRGRGDVWSSGTTTPPLRWLDGVETTTHLHVRPFNAGADSITVEWWSEEDTWVDFNYAGSEFGTFSNPFNSLAEGVSAASYGGTVKLKPSTSSETATITKRLNLEAVGGTVIIGRQ